MKPPLLLAALLASVVGVSGQGLIVFNNRLLTSGPVGSINEPLYAPIYGINPNNPTQILTGPGNAVGPGGAPLPAFGTTDYSGRELLAGTAFTAQLWYGALGTSSGDLVLASAATSTFRTGVTTVGAFNGSTAILDNPAAMIPGGPGTRAVFQVRAWDNMGGSVTSWAAVLADSTVPRGASPLFTPNFDLGDGMGTTAPHIIGLQSFGLYIVPEPSLVALGLLGAGLLFFARRTRH